MGATGAQGSPGVSSWELDTNAQTITLTANEGVNQFETCTSGKTVLGGGVIQNLSFPLPVIQSGPSSSTEWEGGVFNNTGGSITGTLTVYAICGIVQ
jgi:hypothetical protein